MAGNGNAAPTWLVTSQREDYQLGKNGQLVQGMVVTFQTRSGAVGSVFVEATEYNPQRVRDLVAAKATDMETIAGLSG